MNKKTLFILIIIAIVFFPYHVKAQWSNIKFDYHGFLNRVLFVNHNNGWLFGGDGTDEFISHTKDGGFSWSTLTSNEPGKLSDAYFADSLRGWAVGDYLRIIKTIDGGRTWTDQRWSSNWYSQLRSISFVGDQMGWAAGQNEDSSTKGVIFHTTNGGNVWQEQQIKVPFPRYSLRGIKFTSKENGYAVGWYGDLSIFKGLIARTTNGGATWIIDTTEIPSIFNAIDFVNDTDGWIVGTSGVILHTTNSGNSWEHQSSGTDAYLGCIAGATKDLCWVGGGGATGIVLATSDRGQTWKYQLGATLPAISSLCFINSCEGWGTGVGFLIHYSSDTPLSVDFSKNIPTKYILTQNYPNPFNPTTTISYSVSQTSFVTIKVYDALGRELKTLVNGNKSVGNYTVEFYSSNLSSGIYFYRMQAGNFIETKKLILMK